MYIKMQVMFNSYATLICGENKYQWLTEPFSTVSTEFDVFRMESWADSKKLIILLDLI